jgi:hypothetical protein
MTRLYELDLTVNPNSPFVRDASNKLVRRAYWMDMTDPTFSDGHDERDRCKSDQRRKEGASTDLKREHLIDQVCVQEILPPEK